MKENISVLIVDDSAYSRQTIRKMLESAPEISVAGTAANGVEAMAKVMRLEPDLITLDYEMPEMDGIGFLRWLMKERPTPVIMVTANTDRKTAFRALELGALDVITKPSRRASRELKNIEKDLLAKARGARGLNLDVLSRNLDLFESGRKNPARGAPFMSDMEVTAIGASTGGPPALQHILSRLPSGFPCPIVISQHMPSGFTKPLAERLDKISGLDVKEAKDGDLLERGMVLVCPGGCHLTFRRGAKGVRVFMKEAGFADKYVPSVDVMMVSAAKVFKRKVLGVVLTGMGSDGMKGMVNIMESGGYTVAESEETAVVFGMPGEVIRVGAAKKVLPLDGISNEMIRVVMGERRR